MKIEMKWSLWLAEITSWAYSDYTMSVIVVSANTYEEAKNAVKIYYQNNKDSYRNEWLVFDDWEKWQYKKDGSSKDPFDTCYWYWEDVRLTRLEVVYDWWEIAKPSLHLLPKE